MPATDVARQLPPDVSRLYYPQARVILSIVFDGFGEDAKDTKPKIIPIIPESVTVTRNAYNQADGWECRFDADDLPIDPQMVRAGAVEIFLFATQGIREDERLINRQFTSLDNPDSKRPAKDGVMEEADAADATDRFTLGNDPTVAGLFDDQSLELSDNGRWVSISGQDYTALLISKQWPPTAKGLARRIPINKRLDKIMEQILKEADDTGRLHLHVENIEDSKLPMVRAELRSQRRGIAVGQDSSYWDILYKLATRHGFIVFVRGLDVVLTTPQNLDNDKDARIRHMVMGRNLESLTMTRHLGKETAPAIVVKAYDDSVGKTITVDFPHGSFTKIKQRTSKKTGAINIRKTDEYQIIPIFGVTNRQTLARIAESLYHQLGRSERTVRFVTQDLTDIHDRNLMDLAAGDALAIEFDEFNVNRALLANPAVVDQVKFQHLVDRGFGEAVAQIIASKYTELEALKRPMRVREVTYEYSAETGISIEVELMDFIVVDGVRDPAVKRAKKDKRRTRKDGTALGLTKAREKALKTQFAKVGGS